MDEAEHCQRLAFIHGGRIVALGSPRDIKENVMHGQVLEIDCDQPEAAILALRQLGLFDEVALYGALIHVIAENGEGHKSTILKTLRDEGIKVQSVDLIAPSLEDVFVSSLKEK